MIDRAINTGILVAKRSYANATVVVSHTVRTKFDLRHRRAVLSSSLTAPGIVQNTREVLGGKLMNGGGGKKGEGRGGGRRKRGGGRIR